jgi:hypothetical protein
MSEKAPENDRSLADRMLKFGLGILALAVGIDILTD